MASPHDPYAALRFRDYRCLLGASLLASIGAEIEAVAVGWELYERTDSAAAMGYAGLARFLPVLILSIPAGQLADRISRKRMLQLALLAIATSALGLAYLSAVQGPVWLIYLCLSLAGCGRAFSMPSRWALLPQVVPGEYLGNAVTWNSSGLQIASVAGPALGGWLIAKTGWAMVVYLVSAAALFACAMLVVPIRPKPVVRPPENRSLTSLLAGVRFVWSNELLLAAITLDLFAVLLGGATALLPIFAKDILKIGPVGLGWLRAAPALGALLMALVIAHRPPMQRAGWTLLLAVAGFGAAMIGFGLSDRPFLSFLLLALTGALDNISVVVRGTLMQVLTPDAMRGRVASVNLIFISSSNELGAFESGITAEWFGPIRSVVGGGMGTILVVLAVMARWPSLLHLGRLQRPEPSPDAVVQAEEAEETQARPVP